MRGIFQARSVAVAFLALTMVIGGCTAKTADNDKSNTLVTVVGMQALSESESGTAADNLNSDVCSNEGAVWPPGCTAVEDYGVVTMVAQPKAVIAALGPGPFSSVVFDRYRVTFIRADGRNVPGIDVPYPFDGTMTFQVPPDGAQYSKNFILVRHQSKLESPVANLAGNGGAIVISTLAQIDFYGKDLAGNAVTARGQINVTFGDF